MLLVVVKDGSNQRIPDYEGVQQICETVKPEAEYIPMSTRSTANALPLRTNCSQCGKLRAHPNFAIGRLDPWMVHARMHY